MPSILDNATKYNMHLYHIAFSVYRLSLQLICLFLSFPSKTIILNPVFMLVLHSKRGKPLYFNSTPISDLLAF